MSAQFVSHQISRFLTVVRHRAQLLKKSCWHFALQFGMFHMIPFLAILALVLLILRSVSRGKGPPGGSFKLCSANIGSVSTNHDWKSWGADLLCLQEAKNNSRSANFSFRDAGYEAVLGDLLPGLLHKVGRQHTPCGGTAVLAAPGFVRACSEHDDATGLFRALFQSKRVSGAWVQIAPKRKLLVFSIYATRRFMRPTMSFSMISSKFVHSLGQSLSFWRVIFKPSRYLTRPFRPQFTTMVWHDPLLGSDVDGALTRPHTFSNDGLFSGQGEGRTSIDGVLMNSPACFALDDCQVVPIIGRQHRPIQCTFQWSTLEQVGFIHYRSAPLDISSVPNPWGKNRSDDELFEAADSDDTLWDEHWENEFLATSDPDQKWKVINDFCVSSLVALGASWGDGHHERAQPPRFVPKKVCPPQHANHCAATRYSSQLHRLHNRLNELAIRRARVFGSAEDFHVFRTTVRKVQRGFQSLKLSLDWPTCLEITLVHIQDARNLVDQLLESHYKQLKSKRIGSWKARIKHSAATGSSYIFQRLKNKLQDEPSNLVEDEDGNILYQPDKALAHLNNKWDDVYSANILHEHPLQMLNVVWPYIQDKITTVDLPR